MECVKCRCSLNSRWTALSVAWDSLGNVSANWAKVETWLWMIGSQRMKNVRESTRNLHCLHYYCPNSDCAVIFWSSTALANANRQRCEPYPSNSLTSPTGLRANRPAASVCDGLSFRSGSVHADWLELTFERQRFASEYWWPDKKMGSWTKIFMNKIRRISISTSYLRSTFQVFSANLSADSHWVWWWSFLSLASLFLPHQPPPMWTSPVCPYSVCRLAQPSLHPEMPSTESAHTLYVDHAAAVSLKMSLFHRWWSARKLSPNFAWLYIVCRICSCSRSAWERDCLAFCCWAMKIPAPALTAAIAV